MKLNYNNEISNLLNLSQHEDSFLYGHRYTTPKSYGVYKVYNGLNNSETYHFGNHPIRQKEIMRINSSCLLVSLFLDRNNANKLSRLLNLSR